MIRSDDIKYSLDFTNIDEVYSNVLFQQFEMTEEEQLAWAVKDSEKERERLHKLAQQEEHELQQALSLSQADTGSSEA